MNLKIKLFADGADIGEMIKVHDEGLVSGFTTNPTLMRKAGVKDYVKFAKSVLKAIPDVPVSFEVFSDDLMGMKREAEIISSWGENVFVKIPVTNSCGVSTATIIDMLSDDGIKLNITAILDVNQVRKVMFSINKNTPSIISVFAGRIADTGRDPIPIMKESLKLIGTQNTELLWASTRELLNVIQAQNCDCDIITVTPDILKKLPMLGKDLTDLSLDTVKMFRNDALLSGYMI